MPHGPFRCSGHFPHLLKEKNSNELEKRLPWKDFLGKCRTHPSFPFFRWIQILMVMPISEHRINRAEKNNLWSAPQIRSTWDQCWCTYFLLSPCNHATESLPTDGVWTMKVHYHSKWGSFIYASKKEKNMESFFVFVFQISLKIFVWDRQSGVWHEAKKNVFNLPETLVVKKSSISIHSYLYRAIFLSQVTMWTPQYRSLLHG